MASKAPPPLQGARRSTSGWYFVLIIALLYVAGDLWCLSDDRYLHDEGLLTYICSDFLRRDPIVTFFWPKARPLAALMNLPGALFGLNGFFVGHVLICALGLALIALAGRRMNLRYWPLPAAFMALSPSYFAGGASGVSDADGVVASAAAFAACFGGIPGGFAGLLLGVLPFVRYELGILTVFLTIYAVWNGSRWRFLAGVAAGPLAYVAGGALYHHSILWLLRFPPSIPYVDPSVYITVANDLKRMSFNSILLVIGNNAPALPLVLLLAAPHRGNPFGRAERMLLLYMAVFVTAMCTLPLLHTVMTFSERYYLPVLPAVALLASRGVESIELEDRRGVRLFLASLVALCGAAAISARSPELIVLSTAGLALVAGLFMRRARAAPVFVLTASVLAFALAPPPHEEALEKAKIATRWLREHPAAVPPLPIYTTLHLLSAYSSRSGHVPGLDVVDLLRPEMKLEMSKLSDTKNGQTDALFRLMRVSWNGRAGDPAEIVAGHAPPGSLLIMDTGDPRTARMIPMSFVQAHTSLLMRDGSLWIVRIL